jgi:hypothetical protein
LPALRCARGRAPDALVTGTEAAVEARDIILPRRTNGSRRAPRL